VSINGSVTLVRVLSVCVRSNCSQLVATCGYEDVRVWNLNDHREILRISVPNMHCYAVTITVDGRSILSGQCRQTHDLLYGLCWKQHPQRLMHACHRLC